MHTAALVIIELRGSNVCGRNAKGGIVILENYPPSNGELSGSIFSKAKVFCQFLLCSFQKEERIREVQLMRQSLLAGGGSNGSDVLCLRMSMSYKSDFR
jgi:hypothetical protein